eukprot:254685-Pyramimonas_sp.AAC.1
MVIAIIDGARAFDAWGSSPGDCARCDAVLAWGVHAWKYLRACIGSAALAGVGRVHSKRRWARTVREANLKRSHFVYLPVLVNVRPTIFKFLASLALRAPPCPPCAGLAMS